jgi:hypothetical protein
MSILSIDLHSWLMHDTIVISHVNVESLNHNHGSVSSETTMCLDDGLNPPSHPSSQSLDVLLR